MLPRRREFDLLRRQAADDAQSGPRSRPRLAGSARTRAEPELMSPIGSPDWLAAGLHHLWVPYARVKTAAPPLPVKRTEGCRIILDDGRALIDGIASWWTGCHGYNHPHIAAALARQLETLPHVMFAGLAHEQAARLATRLAALLPGDLERVFFS